MATIIRKFGRLFYCAPIFLFLSLASSLAHSTDGSEASNKTQGEFVSLGKINSITLPSPVAPVNIVVWLPPGYQASTTKYPVVYMQDGQNLFFKERSNFNKVWAADQSAARVINTGKVQPFIIVGIDQPGVDRARTYMPNYVYESLPSDEKHALSQFQISSNLSDQYLEFIVKELKPLIDNKFRTLPDAEHTAIIGSSMGGLISLYAIAQYPTIFGKAGCVSTHWPLGDPRSLGNQPNKAIIAAWEQFTLIKLGKPNHRVIWFDHGTETLDSLYEPYQLAVDKALRDNHWVQGKDFESKVYPGQAHEENAWASRLDEIFLFLWAKH